MTCGNAQGVDGINKVRVDERQMQMHMRGKARVQGDMAKLMASQQGDRRTATARGDPGHRPVSPTASTLDGKQPPLARHTFEEVLAASGKAEARPGN